MKINRGRNVLLFSGKMCEFTAWAQSLRIAEQIKREEATHGITD